MRSIGRLRRTILCGLPRTGTLSLISLPPTSTGVVLSLTTILSMENLQFNIKLFIDQFSFEYVLPNIITYLAEGKAHTLSWMSLSVEIALSGFFFSNWLFTSISVRELSFFPSKNRPFNNSLFLAAAMAFSLVLRCSSRILAPLILTLIFTSR